MVFPPRVEAPYPQLEDAPSVSKASAGPGSPAEVSKLSPEFSKLPPGWTDPRDLLVKSDGSRSFGTLEKDFNDSRDQGSKIAYFHPKKGNNANADVYFWDGKQLVDSKGQAKNAAGLAYGTDPLKPNEEAIRPFADLRAERDPRLRVQKGRRGYKGHGRAWQFAGLAGGYPDWFLFRRGEIHTEFDSLLVGGRSEKEPMVVAGYGPVDEGRAIIDPSKKNPFSGHNFSDTASWFHHALFSLEIRDMYGFYGAHEADTLAPGGGPVTAYLEDCLFAEQHGGYIVYPPTKTTFFRTIIKHSFFETSHNQGYYTDRFKNQVLFDRVIFYRNGYKEDPRKNADPKRDIYSRNVYQGGGAKLGHRYYGVIHADGASGGPQMRFGGIIENSLVIEGYWYSSTMSNKVANDWLVKEGQTGQSARVRNNVQLTYRYPTPKDPDPGKRSDNRAQPANGYTLSGASFGALIEGNIVSGAMVLDELGAPLEHAGTALELVMPTEEYGTGNFFSQKNNTIRHNIFYKTRFGLRVSDGADAENIRVTHNVFVTKVPLFTKHGKVTSPHQLLVDHNRFYSEESLPNEDWLQENTRAAMKDARSKEGWPDPNRTLKRYVREVLGLKLLTWSDDPFLEPEQARQRASAGEEYDPTGMKTFMAVAANMRRGGAEKPPSQGKPQLGKDYAWDSRFEGPAVVSYIRQGFGLQPVSGPGLP